MKHIPTRLILLVRHSWHQNRKYYGTKLKIHTPSHKKDIETPQKFLFHLSYYYTPSIFPSVYWRRLMHTNERDPFSFLLLSFLRYDCKGSRKSWKHTFPTTTTAKKYEVWRFMKRGRKTKWDFLLICVCWFVLIVLVLLQDFYPRREKKRERKKE